MRQMIQPAKKPAASMLLWSVKKGYAGSRWRRDEHAQLRGVLFLSFLLVGASDADSGELGRVTYEIFLGDM